MGQFLSKTKPVETDPMLPVLEAVREGKVSKLQEYQSIIKDFQEITDKRKSLLHLAIINGQVQCVEYLLKAGIEANVFEAYVSPLHELVQAKGITPANVSRMFNLLIAHGANINAPNSMKRTPLLKSIILFRQNISEMLLDNNANVHLADVDGLFPLHVCATYANVRIMHKLLQAGADINAQDKKGRTALYYAVLSGHQNIIEELLQRGCDINLGSVFGYPLQTAIVKCKPEAVQQLLEYGANVNFFVKEHRQTFSKAKDCLNLALLVLHGEYTAAQTGVAIDNRRQLYRIVCITDLILQAMGVEVSFAKNIFIKSRKGNPIDFDKIEDPDLRKKFAKVCRMLVFLHTMQQLKGPVVLLDGMPKCSIDRRSLENICRMRVRQLLTQSGTNAISTVQHLDCSIIVKDLLLLKDI